MEDCLSDFSPSLGNSVVAPCYAKISFRDFTQRVVGPWHRLLREVVDAPFLEVFRPRLERP